MWYKGKPVYIDKNGLAKWSNSNVFVCVDDDKFNDDDIEYAAWTDGACDNLCNMRPGGSAYIIMKNGEIIRAKNKGLMNTSNNRAEMLAIVSAVLHTPEGARLDIYTDSQYSLFTFAGRYSPKANLDLIEQFNRYARSLGKIVFHWVRGHNGDENNEMVDDMAYSAYMEMVDMYGLKVGNYSKGGK